MTHLSLDTTDRSEAEAFLNELYSLEIDPPDPGQGFGIRFTSDALDSVAVTRTRYTMQFRLKAVEPIGATSISRMRAGRLGFRIGSRENRWRAGDVFVGLDAGCDWEAVVRDCDVDSVSIAPATFATVATAADGGPVALSGYEPVSAEAARLWLNAFEYARHVATQPDVTPLVAGLTARMLAATALATFPSNALLDPTSEDRNDAHPATVRRAIAFIEADPDVDLTVVDIARAAFVTPRALQLAFRRHLDTTPMAYLRRVRLDRAHADLRTADRDDTTVTAIANRWGFANPGRFAVQYRAAYGCSPSITLDQSC